MKPTIYAVVDVETTGTDPEKDRIIQFGCVLIENEKIVSRFATDVNPAKAIPKQIQSLTGITNGRVQKAPYFEDIAFTIYNLLQDTVFVAHNIFFDYKFLNHELKRCGVPELSIPGIDTVELAQIFLPAQASFRLKDLSDALGLTHENPHQADSDAEVTAKLLLTIQEKIRSLPVCTVERIVELSKLTGMDTGGFIAKNLALMKESPKDLPEDLEAVNGIVLRKKEVSLYSENYFSDKEYPKTPSKKRKVFKDKLAFRIEQHQLMNLVQKHFEADTAKDFIIEAATGLGKTIGYLFPLSYLATPENPAVISTASIILQQQILDKDIPLLNEVIDQPIQATLVKSSRHYIDLQRFYATLEAPVEHKQYALYQMAVLVWLTETKTGDFDELHMTALSHVFWNDIRHHGVEYLSKNQPFYQEDFLIHLHQQMAQSNFLITNHAYLAQESLRDRPALPASSFLLIDEAHHLSENLERGSRKRFSSTAFRKKISQMLQPEHFFDQMLGLLEGNDELAHQVSLYRNALEDLIEEQTDFFTELTRLLPARRSKNYQEEFVMEKPLFDSLSDFGYRGMEKCRRLYEDILMLQDQLEEAFLLSKEEWNYRQRRLYSRLFSLFSVIRKEQIVFEDWTQDWQERYVHWLVPDKNGSGATLCIHDYQAAILPETVWYPRYEKILYLGGTIQIGNDRHYFPKRWGIPDAKVKVLKDPYDYEKQVKVFVPDKAVSVNETESSGYANFLADTIFKVAGKEKRRVLILFTSHELLQAVYLKVHLNLLNQGREVLAQGVGGSREKILKRFFLSEDDILLGADSFWEGVDLPGDTLQLLIVTRLPFENPKRPLVRARNAYLEARGISAFFQEAIPKTALKLRQALGRLIRSEDDRGVMIILDRRLLTAAYSKRLMKAFPEKCEVIEESMEAILEDTHQFLEKNKKENSKQNN